MSLASLTWLGRWPQPKAHGTPHHKDPCVAFDLFTGLLFGMVWYASREKGFLYVHLSSAPGRARAVGESGVGTCGWPATCIAGTSLDTVSFLGF